MILNLVGAGRVARTLGRLWRAAGIGGIGTICARSPASAAAAAAFIGGGSACDGIAAMAPAPVWLLAVPDDRIAACADALAASGRCRPGDIVFHCSGALSSGALAAAAACGAAVASLHPLKTFAEPATAVRTFAGTACAAEGDAAALALLELAFESLGARVFRIERAAKTLYHAASVLVCNDLTALLEAGLRAYAAAGIARAEALRMMEPLVRETLDNVFALGPARALTGPVARGDLAVVEQHLAALDAGDARIAAVYRSLGALAVELARAGGGAPADALAALAARFAQRGD